MKILRAYKTKIRPTVKQARYFGGCVGAARFVYNWALADRKATFEAGGKPNKFEQKRRFNAAKDDFCPWTRDYPYVLMQEEFDNVDAAYKNFFRRIKNGKGGKEAGFPKFKKRGDRGSFTLRGSIRVEDGRIKLPKIGWVNLAENGYIPTDLEVKYAVVSERAGDWFVSVLVEEDAPDPLPIDGNVLGIDVGIKTSAVFSDGREFENVAALRNKERKMARLQRELSRRKKGSSNWKKTKAKISKMHRKIADTRKHHQHDISRAATDGGSRIVVLEDLNVKGMMSTPKPKENGNGGFSKNGKAAKSGLNKSLSDVGLSEIHRQIEYKAGWSGIEVIKADRFFPSSKTCSGCGYIDRELKLSDRTYKCPNCGLEIDRDFNAALNLAAYGERLRRPGLPVELDGLPATVKQEGGG